MIFLFIFNIFFNMTDYDVKMMKMFEKSDKECKDKKIITYSEAYSIGKKYFDNKRIYLIQLFTMNEFINNTCKYMYVKKDNLDDYKCPKNKYNDIYTKEYEKYGVQFQKLLDIEFFIIGSLENTTNKDIKINTKCELFLDSKTGKIIIYRCESINTK